MDSNLQNKIEFLIGLKLKQLQRNSLASLKYEQIERTLFRTKWQKRVPLHICEIASDIDSLTVEDVVNFLTREALVSRNSLSELAESMEGE